MPTPPPRRPGSVRTFGILNLVFAGMGVLGLAMTYAMHFSGVKLDPPNPTLEVAMQAPGYMDYIRVSVVTSALGVIALAVAGIGLLRMRAWARKLSIAYAVYAILNVITGLVATRHYLAELSRSSDPAAEAGVMGGLVGALIGLAYPVLLFVFMMKKDVRDAFDRANTPPIPPARVQ